MAHYADPDSIDIRQKLRVSFLVIVPFLCTMGAIVLLWNKYVFWSDIALMTVLYFVTGLGITVGYHRMLTHQGFKAPEWLRAFILICGAMAWDGEPLVWTATHIKHHAHSDEDGDPHSPLEGFWHAHMGWLFHSKNFPIVKEYAPQLLEDKTAVWVDKHVGKWMLLSLLIPFVLGGWTGLLWGGFVRIFLLSHVTWSVNSICHTFGKRDFETTDESRNNWLVGLVGFGEGWHNNHHAFPQSAFHGLRWWQPDLSGALIRIAERLGLMWDVVRVSEETQEAQRIRMSSSREAATTMREQLTQNLKLADVEMQKFFAGAIGKAVDDVDRASILALHSTTAVRIAAIQQQVSKATNMKKQQVAMLTSEFQKTMQYAKEQTQLHMQRFAVRTQ